MYYTVFYLDGGSDNFTLPLSDVLLYIKAQSQAVYSWATNTLYSYHNGKIVMCKGPIATPLNNTLRLYDGDVYERRSIVSDETCRLHVENWLLKGKNHRVKFDSVDRVFFDYRVR